MKKMYDVRKCRNCGTSFNWLATNITAELKTLPNWSGTLIAYGVNCCSNPEMNNSQRIGNFYLEVE